MNLNGWQDPRYQLRRLPAMAPARDPTLPEQVL